MFLLSFTSSALKFCSVIQTSIYENPELRVFKNINFLYEISNNRQNDFYGKNVYETLELR